MTSSPFGGAPAGTSAGATMGPFEAAALARSPFEAAPAPETSGAPVDAASSSSPFSSEPVASPFGAVPAPRPAAETGPRAEVPEPAALRGRPTRPERPSLRLPSRAGTGGGAGGARRSPLLVLALGGGALVAGALVAGVVLGSTDDIDTTGPVVVAGSAATPLSTAAPSTGTDPGTDPATGTDGQPSEPLGGGAAALGRDPFAALVAPAAGSGATSDAAPDPAATGLPGGSVDTSGGTTASTGGTSTSGGGAGGAAVTNPVPQTTVTVTAPPSSAATPLTTAQTCSAVSGPLTAVEQLLTGSSSSGAAPVDTGTALRTPVAALRAAVGATGDAALASRLDVATSSAESLRAQLLGGTAVTSAQLDTQASLDAAVRTACA